MLSVFATLYQASRLRSGKAHSYLKKEGEPWRSFEPNVSPTAGFTLADLGVGGSALGSVFCPDETIVEPVKPADDCLAASGASFGRACPLNVVAKGVLEA